MSNGQSPPDQLADQEPENPDSDEDKQELLRKLREKRRALRERMQKLDEELCNMSKERQRIIFLHLKTRSSMIWTTLKFLLNRIPPPN